MRKLRKTLARAVEPRPTLPVASTWSVSIRGGDFSISVADSRLSIVEGLSAGAEHILVADDPAIFTRHRYSMVR